ncbi:hypothetical protein [Rhodoflexus caldus]|uniref:hypothetical protein n=1 Tax=Rhodoflexus caldus TaxID=2891236 RepID=UPI00202AA766|nr:hypothetical protein [Rhodoflexus caldus]
MISPLVAEEKIIRDYSLPNQEAADSLEDFAQMEADLADEEEAWSPPPKRKPAYEFVEPVGRPAADPDLQDVINRQSEEVEAEPMSFVPPDEDELDDLLADAKSEMDAGTLNSKAAANAKMYVSIADGILSNLVFHFLLKIPEGEIIQATSAGTLPDDSVLKSVRQINERSKDVSKIPEQAMLQDAIADYIRHKGAKAILGAEAQLFTTIGYVSLIYVGNVTAYMQEVRAVRADIKQALEKAKGGEKK